jgi:predicted RNA binding protein YcfA (HicA-like mRNA interferase family)
VRPSEAVAAPKRASFFDQREKRFLIFRLNEQGRKAAIVAVHSYDFPARTLKQILKQAGLSDTEFRNLL